MTNLNAYEEMLGTGQSNNKLMDHIGLVKRVALHLKTRLPNFMELEELIQVGTIGLIEAAKSFDDSKGVEFEIFARTRIRGAILDQVRKLSYYLGLQWSISEIIMRQLPRFPQNLGVNQLKQN